MVISPVFSLFQSRYCVSHSIINVIGREGVKLCDEEVEAIHFWLK